VDIPKSITNLAQKANINKFQLVSLLSKRARDLMFGAKPLIEDKNGNYVHKAMREFVAGKIKVQA